MTFYDDLLAAGREAEQSFVRVSRAEDRAVVVLEDPAKLNVLSAPLVLQLRSALEELVGHRSIRSIVLTGEDPGFSAGGDLRMMDDAPKALASPAGAPDIWRWIRNEFGGIVRLIARSDVAFIAAINGPAAGVGLAWALTCDLAIASERARIVPAFGRLGLLPEVGTSWAITRKLGYQGAFAYYAGGEHLDAQQARALGLVHEVVPHERLLAAADAWCTKIAALPPHALEMTKPLLRAAADGSWESALVMEEFAEPQCFTTGAFQGVVEQLLSKGPQEVRTSAASTRGPGRKDAGVQTDTGV
jgi:2-(1,2-epoxy-1,2-dihydrophenyl)acetyl-CoA isomerase